MFSFWVKVPLPPSSQTREGDVCGHVHGLDWAHKCGKCELVLHLKKVRSSDVGNYCHCDKQKIIIVQMEQSSLSPA